MIDITALWLWFGIDISKKFFDVALFSETKNPPSRRFANTASGFADFIQWTRKVAGEDANVKFCMEATGDYGVDLALFLSEAGFHVSVVNPAFIKYFGIYKGRQNKTDKADAKLIAAYAQHENPENWPMSEPDRRQLFRLHRRRLQLKKMENAEKNRKDCPDAIGPECLGSVNGVLKVLRKEISTVERLMSEIIEENPRFKEEAELIQSIPGLAERSAETLIAEMPLVEKCQSAKSWAAAAGVHPSNRQSGSDNKPGKLSRTGRKVVRSQCFMPVLKSYRAMPELSHLYDRLVARGRTHKQALAACVHKLLMIVYGVLTSKKKYDISKSGHPLLERVPSTKKRAKTSISQDESAKKTVPAPTLALQHP